MAKWLKLYATYTFSTSPHLCHHTTLLNTDVPNCYIKLVCESGIHQSSVHRIVKKELQLKCLKKTNAQELTAANKQARMTWARQLLNQFNSEPVSEPNGEFHVFLLTKSYSPSLPRPTHRTIVFTSIRGTRKNINENWLLQMRSTFSKSVGGRPTNGCRTLGLAV